MEKSVKLKMEIEQLHFTVGQIRYWEYNTSIQKNHFFPFHKIYFIHIEISSRGGFALFIRPVALAKFYLPQFDVRFVFYSIRAAGNAIQQKLLFPTFLGAARKLARSLPRNGDAKSTDDNPRRNPN